MLETCISLPTGLRDLGTSSVAYCSLIVISGSRVEAMAPVARKPLPEEKLLAGLAKLWAYIAYTTKQLIILFPNLWAGYENRRRKEEIRSSSRSQCIQQDSDQAEEAKQTCRWFIQTLGWDRLGNGNHTLHDGEVNVSESWSDIY